jgi:hypothetical protein
VKRQFRTYGKKELQYRITIQRFGEKTSVERARIIARPNKKVLERDKNSLARP